MTYLGARGGQGNLELDVNFMLRTPLWPCPMRDCHPVGSFPRRLRAHALLANPDLDPAKLRLGFVVYGGINRRDWRTVSPADVVLDPNEVQTALVPMLRADRAPARHEIAAWTKKLEMECRERLSLVLPLNEHELEFLRRLNDKGEIAPELLTSDSGIQATLHTHPGLKWKAQNVRKHHALDRSDGSDLL